MVVHKSFQLQFSFHPLFIPVGALSLCLFAAFRSIGKHGRRDPLDKVVPSPLETSLPKLSEGEIHRLPYPPDLFPGARDVQTPYGNIRVYEWGPENGRKVLFVHGISTPCLSLGAVAEKLAENGCRVMLFDLFGRGYSDDPADLNHDARLYTTQILLAIASSPLAWTGTNGFNIIGYSLGGGIASSFTDTFPNLVESLIIMAPSGLVRESHIAWSSKFLYSTEGLLPEPLVHYLVRRRLTSGANNSPPPQTDRTDPTSALAAETGGSGQNERYARRASSVPSSALFPHRPMVTVNSAVEWQLAHHIGFVPAFISAIRFAPIQNQHASWKRIGSRLTAQKLNSADREAMSSGLWRSKVLLILGRTDPIIVKDEIVADATACFGPGNLETVVIDGGHDIPTSDSKAVSKAILRFWGEDLESIDATAEVEVETGT